ncbi:MAG: 30S ribosomal protein S17e [Candidatus Nanoarchaeia archaeon]|nr:30S ribosomal protein S17e [Candidatus Nanoarchaeia archaeon]MDD5239840.1 30S ribosomal protein S17e [Candidatus Nanoarchaeia archaeon]
MGRIRTTYVKRMTRKIIEHFPDRFTKEFSKNKALLKEVTETPSKQLRNKIAGSITRTLKTQKE